MRVFVNCCDLTGTRRNTRLTLHNCTNTTILLRQVCKELAVSRTAVVITLKLEPHNLAILEGWPLEHYPIRNGSVFLLQPIDSHLPDTLQPIDEEDFQEETLTRTLSQSEPIPPASLEAAYSHWLEDSLQRLLALVRAGDLSGVSLLMKEEPPLQDEQQLQQLMVRKNSYLMNQLGECGRSALHWAVHSLRPDIVSFLLIKGAKPSVVSLDGYSALQLAVQHHSLDIAALLLEHHGTDPSQNTQHGTALHLAARNQDIKCLRLLLQHEADVAALDSEDRTPAQVTDHPDILMALKTKASMGKMAIPKISQGNVFLVSQTTYRNKERTLQVNPFKDYLKLTAPDSSSAERLALGQLDSVQTVEDKSWLMKNSHSYFNIRVKGQEKGLMIAVKHPYICQKWIKHIQAAIKYHQCSDYLKPVSPADQVIEHLDDIKGEALLHKRKIDNQPPLTKATSIIDLKPLAQDHQSPKKCLKKTSEEGSQSAKSNEEDMYRDSEIMLGSVIGLGRTPSSSSNLSFEGHNSHEPNSNRFRKNSDVRVEEVSQFNGQPQTLSVSYVDFDVLDELGTGAFGKVYLAKFKPTGQTYALKTLNKKKLFVKKQLKYAVGQTNILKKMDSPFIVKLHFAFQTPNSLYMAIDHCSLGDLAELITVKEVLKESTARFVIAQLVLAIEYLHKHNILYRDLKPENILIDRSGYIKLTDFGLSRQNNFAASFCGSPAYLSPEMLEKKGVGTSSDIYGIGCVLYEMVVGEPPFFNEDMDVLFQNIKNGKLRFPSNLSAELKSLISKLLDRDIHRRLGVQDIEDIKRHQFLKKVDWKQLEAKRAKVPGEMFANREEELLVEGLELRKAPRAKLIDYDYNESTRMVNRIQKFSFVRESSLYAKTREQPLQSRG